MRYYDLFIINPEEIVIIELVSCTSKELFYDKE